MSELMGFLLWLDRCINVLLGGSFDETLSSRAHRMEVSGHPYWGWTARAQVHYVAFANALGVEIKATVAVAPNPAGNPNRPQVTGA